MSIIPVSFAQEAAKRPVLHEFITQILEGHPSLLSTEASLRAVEARAQGKARSIYNPEIEIGYVNNRDRDKEIGISQTIDWSGKRRARSKVGRAEVAASKSVYFLVKKDLITEMLQSLTEYQTALKIYKVAEDRTSLSEDFLKLAQRRNLAGELPRSELLTAMLALSESQAVKNKASSELSQSKENLIALVGEDREVWPNLSGIPVANDALTFVDDIETLPEIALARNQIEISKAQINVARSERKPDPTIGVAIRQEGGGSRFDAEPRHTSVGLKLSLPIPIWNSYKAEVRASGADLNQAEQDYFVIENKVRARLDATINRYQSAASAWSEWSKQGAMPLSEQRDLLKRLLEAQEIGAVDYLIQLNQTFEVENTSIELNGRLWNAWFAWQNASNTFDVWLEKIQ
ncbi:MAG: TolC family protein [Emcibacteraceae bacterium]|nr:TolC family protein [Emcibacteraceae bacterium]